jgi:hypothetical protein
MTAGRNNRNAESTEVCRTPRGNNTDRGPTTTAAKSTRGVARPTASPATVLEHYIDSHWSDARWDGTPELPVTQAFATVTQRRMSSVDNVLFR